MLGDELDDEKGIPPIPLQKGEPGLASQTTNPEQAINGAIALKESDSSAERLSESATAKSR